MNRNAGKFQSYKRFDVRFSVTQELTDLGLFVKKEDNPMSVPFCSRSRDVIEPILKPQWYMKIKSLAEPAIRAVREEDIKIIPASSEKVYYH
jgi:valyl-tRNA synthetase